MKTLFSELKVAGLTARNRIVRAATAESLASPTGCPSRALRDLYVSLAEGGVGTIITGYSYIRPDGKPSEGALGMYDDTFLDDYRELTEAVHERGCAIVAQLVYGGSKSKLAPDDERRMEVWADGNAPKPHEPNVTILGPSAVEHPATGLIPTPATAGDLRSLTWAFGEAAARAHASGFDGVEVHAAHGYLLSQFLSARFNKRGDEYGGQLMDRARLALECVAAVRERVDSRFSIFVKLNCCDDADDPAGERGGLSEDDSLQVASWLVEAGADCIEVSGDWHAASSRSGGAPYFADYGAKLAGEVDAPIIVTGGWRDPALIERHLAREGIAGVGMSRPLICEPDLPNRWQSGDAAPSRCVGCGSCLRGPGVPCPQR